MCERGDTRDARTDQPTPATILDATKVSQGGRISLVEAVEEAFARRGFEIEEGDRIVYKEYDEHIVIEPANPAPNSNLGRLNSQDSRNS